MEKPVSTAAIRRSTTRSQAGFYNARTRLTAHDHIPHSRRPLHTPTGATSVAPVFFDAIVAREAGTTRDSIYRRIDSREGSYILVDTAGSVFVPAEFIAIQDERQPQSSSWTTPQQVNTSTLDWTRTARLSLNLAAITTTTSPSTGRSVR